MSKLSNLLHKFSQFYQISGHCLLCGKVHTSSSLNDLVCNKCEEHLSYFPQGTCPISGAPSVQRYLFKIYGFDDVRALFTYGDNIRKLLLGFKYGNNYLYFRYLRKLLHQEINENRDFIAMHDTISTIPSHPFSLIKRGQNPAASLIDKLTPLNFEDNLLSKKVYLKKMASMKASDRKRLRKRKIFHCNKNLKGRSILLFDDVMTTGTTVFNAAKELRKYNPDRISLLLLARNLSSLNGVDKARQVLPIQNSLKSKTTVEQI